MARGESGGRHMSDKKASEAGRGDPDRGSPAAVERYLKGIDFPASKRDLVSHARDNNAPDDVIRVLDRMPEREYGSTADVAKGVGQVE